ncbi:MAG: methyl-accepting chemotaxis protein [Rhodocyclaceae bacterium]
MLEHMTLRIRIILLVVVALLAVMALSIWSAVSTRNEMIDGRKEVIRAVMDSAYNLAHHYHALERAGALSREQAQRAVADSYLAGRYGGADRKAEYVYAWTVEGVGVAHVREEMIGQNMLDRIRDGAGRYTLKDILAALRASPEGAAYVNTSFPRPGQQEPVPKLQYAMLFEPWGWFIGTGVYMDDVDSEFRQRLLSMLGVVALILLLLGGIGVVIARGVLRQVGGEPREAIALMARAARGDLTVEVHTAPPGSMLASFGDMVRSIRQMVLEIGSGAQRLAAGAERISSASSEVAVASQHQADATATMAAAIEQMTVSINHISDSARETEADSASSAQLADEGQVSVMQASEDIQRIASSVTDASSRVRALDERARQISSIAGVIKEIAGQTNLLALNAAIEAARAGEQGRGFAVVADEVRKLAERTATATVEIEQMIHGIQTETGRVVSSMDEALPQVDQGVQASCEAADALRRIKSGAESALGRIREVAHATREQSVASSSIAQKVEEIAQMVEETNAATRSSAQIAAELEGISSELQKMVGRFRC